ncbi:hypothetical protein [Flavobacterium fluviale]|uniref:Uncharacterized protein n=1 Tax=Flavobacterium fluviale TaxID=2249356 RepID=A0A344LXH3_9FLAO|nr:hypothetical protein [Flavobacterium fluviale]AXB58615.1 hypothetical protein HYN86_19300 [Flavobacterium fluviale]
MSYFGGLGAGRGWNTFKFILTPKEFESIFNEQKFHFIITNSRVYIDYKKTDEQFIFNSYEDFFNSVIIAKSKLGRKEQWFFESKIRISITDDLSKIDFENIRDKKEKISKDFKLVRPTEPVLNISPFYLTYSKTKESISVANMNEEGTIGLELTYPKFVSFSNDSFNSIVDAHTFTTYNLFDDLMKNIKAISSKARLQSNTKLFRPNFWISTESKKIINTNPYLKSNNLIII